MAVSAGYDRLIDHIAYKAKEADDGESWVQGWQQTHTYTPKEWRRCPRAERIARESGANVLTVGFGERPRAYYDIVKDTVNLPHPRQFRGEGAQARYYQCLFHELAHWTGHPERLDRHTLMNGIMAGLWSAQYAQEELTAELASLALLKVARVQHSIQMSARYIASWCDRPGTCLDHAIPSAAAAVQYITQRVPGLTAR